MEILEIWKLFNLAGLIIKQLGPKWAMAQEALTPLNMIPCVRTSLTLTLLALEEHKLIPTEIKEACLRPKLTSSTCYLYVTMPAKIPYALSLSLVLGIYQNLKCSFPHTVPWWKFGHPHFMYKEGAQWCWASSQGLQVVGQWRTKMASH